MGKNGSRKNSLLHVRTWYPFRVRKTLAIDVREACRSVRTGKGQWTFGLVSELLKQNHNLVLFTDTDLPSSWASSSLVTEKKFSKGFGWHFAAGFYLLKNRSSLMFLAPLSFIIPAFFGRFVQTIVVVHDLIAFRDEPHQAKAKCMERMLLRPAASSAFLLCTISESTKHDLLVCFPNLRKKKITTIYAGPAKTFSPRTTSDGKTIVCIGTLSPRKNQLKLLQAFRSLPRELQDTHEVLLAGARGWQDEAILQLASTLPHVRYLGPVSDAMYEDLLSSAEVLALPSLYEGFGMQVLDALALGVPVVTSNRGSLQEVCGEAAEYVNPDSVEEIAAGLQKLLSNADLRQKLQAAGPAQAAKFSWEKTVNLLLESF
jgi:glycosyltransferase involved in cell wall biosynthesis